MNCKEEAKNLPESPGVYLMRNDVDEIIYVGKAVNLRRRVQQYFIESGKRSKKIEQMIANIDHFTFELTDTELEALILESNLIKKYRPRYNSALRKDENHPYVRISRSDPFPALSVYTGNDRNPEELCMGPFYKPMNMEETVLSVSHLLGLRTCRKDFSGGRFDHHPCLNYHLGNCSGVCLEIISREEYGQKIEKAVEFLRGSRREELLSGLQSRMLEASEQMDFERAVHLRNRYTELKEAAERLQMFRDGKRETMHLWAFAGDSEKDDFLTVVLYMIRGSSLSGRDCFQVPVTQDKPKGRKQLDFLLDFYNAAPFVPDTLLIADNVSGIEELEKNLSKQENRAISVVCTETGEPGRLAKLARESARLMHEQSLASGSGPAVFYNSRLAARGLARNSGQLR